MSASAEPFIVPREQVLDAWPDLAEMIRRVKDQDWEPEDVLEALEQGTAQAWGLRGSPIRTLFITEICQPFTTKYGRVWICAGEHIESGLEMYRSHIEPWFRENGCKWIEVVGRAGWQKVLPDYRRQAVILRRYL